MMAILYWDGSASGSWNDVANWSTVSGGGTDPGAVPGAGDDVIFNATTVTNQVSSLGGVNQAANSIAFAANSTTPIIIAAGNTLTLGTGGITVNGGAAAHAINSTVSLLNSATVTNNSASLFTFGGGISSATAGTQTLSVAGSGNVTFGGIIANGTATALALSKAGVGTLTLSGAGITYTGASTLNAGTLRLLNATGYTSPTTVNSGATLEVSNTVNQGMNAAINLNDGAILTHNALTNGNGFWTTNQPVTVASGASVTLNQASVTNTTGTNKGAFLDGGLMGGGGGAVVTVNATNAGNAFLFRNNNSNFSGRIIVNGIASTTVNAGSGIGVGGNTTGLQNADIELNGTMELLNQGIGWAATASGAFRMGALSGTGVMIGNFTSGGGTTVTLGNTGNAGDFSGVIANGTGNTVHLVKIGTGTQTLSSANSYTGTTSVNAGTLKVTTNGALGTVAGGTVVLSGGTLAFDGTFNYSTLEPITISGIGVGGIGALSKTNGSTTLSTPIIMAGNATIGAGTGATFTISPDIVTVGTLNFTGAGNIVMAGSLTAPPAVSIGNLNALATGDYSFTADSQTFNARVDNVSGTGWLLIGRGREGWQFDTDGQGLVADVNQNLGTSAAFAPALYSNAIVNDLLQQSGINPLGVEVRLRRATNAAGTTWQEARWRNFTNSGWTSVFSNPGVDTNSGGLPATLEVQVSALNAAQTVYAGVQTRDAGDNDGRRVFTWGWSGHAGQRGFSYGASVNLVAGPSPTNFLWESASENHEIPYTEVYVRALGAGPGHVTKNGTGTLTLQGPANTYTGTTTVNGGVLVAAHSSALGTTAAGTLVSPGGTLALPGGINVVGEPLSISGSGAAGQIGALVNTAGINSFSGNVVAVDATIASVAGTLSLSGDINTAISSLAFAGGGNIDVSGVISSTAVPLNGVTGDLEIWLDASDINGDNIANNPGDGALVNTWVDKSGKGRNFDGALGDPNLVAVDPTHGQPAVNFDGNDALRTNLTNNNPRNFIDGNGEFTLISVARYSGADRERVIATVSGHNWLFGFHQGSTNRNGHYDGWGSLDPAPVGFVNDTNWHMHSNQMNVFNDVTNPAGDWWRDGVRVTNDSRGTGDTFNNNVPDGLSLGAWNGLAETSTADVSEFLMYNRVLSDAELNRVQAYLNAKYSLAFPVPAVSSSTITKNGSGTVTLTGDNIFDAAIVVNAGALVAGLNNALGTIVGGTTVNGGELLFANSVNYSTAEPVTLTGGGIGNLSGTNSFAGNVATTYSAGVSTGTFSGGDVGEGLDLDGSFHAAVNALGPGGLQVRDAMFTDQAGEPDITITAQNNILNWQNPNFGATTNDDNLEVVMRSIRWSSNPNTVNIALNNLTPGIGYKTQLLFYEPGNPGRGFDILFDGNLIVDNYTAGVGNSNGAVVTYSFVATAATHTLVLNGANTPFGDKNPVLQAVTVENAPPVIITSYADLLTITGQVNGNQSGLITQGTGDLILNGNVIGTTAGSTLTKNGGGTTTLAGNNTYAGATTVNAGTLLVNGSISSSVVTVQSGATLGGTGTTGPLTINAGGIHSPGNSPGITTVVGNYVENGALIAEIGTPSGSVPGTDYDQVQVTAGGSVTIGGTATLSVPYLGGAGTFAPAFAQVYTIIDNDGAVAGDTTGTFTGLAEGALVTVDGRPLRIFYHGGDGNDVVLVSANNPSGTLYVNDQFTVAGPVDGDLEAAGVQTAYVGVNAFASVAAALTAYPTFSGTIIVNGGTYAFALLAGGGNVTLQLVQDLANAQLDVTLQNISGDATDAIVTRFYNAANANLTVEQGSFAGVISGNGNVTKTTTNSLALSGANTYTGATNVNSGILTISNPTALGSAAGSTTVADQAQLRMSGGITVTGESVTISGPAADFLGALNSFSGTNTWAGPVLLTTNNARIGAVAGQALIVSGVIADATTPAALTVRGGIGGSGLIELSGANTYAGATTLIAGTLRIAGGDNRLPVGTTLNMGNSGNQDFATFNLNGLNQTVGGLTSAGTSMPMTVTNTGALSTLTVNNAAANIYAGVVAGALNVTKLGAGTLNFTGANANTYTGTTTVTAGTLSLGKTAGVNAIPGNVSINGGTLQLAAANQIIDTSAITMSSGVLNFHNGTTARNETLASLSMSGGSVNTAAGGTTNDVTFTGAITATGGSFTVNSGTVLNTNSLSLTGSSSGLLGGNNATRESQLIIGAGGLTMQGTLLQMNRGTIPGALGAHLVLNGNVTTLASATAARILDDGAASPTFLPRIDLNGAVRSFDIADNATANPDMTIGVIIENGGLTKLGAGQLRLTAANAYTGVTTVAAGQLEINSAGGSLTTSPTIDIQAGNFLVTSGANVSTTSVTNGAGTGLLGVDNGTMTVSNGVNVDNFRVGYSNNSPGAATTNTVTGTLTVTGGSASFGSGTGNTFLVGHRTGNGNNNDNVTGTLNLSGASSSTINVNAINLGTVIGSGGGGTVSGIVTLSAAGTNTLTATSTLIGDSPTNGNTGGTGSFLNLGNATNTLNTNTLTIAGMKGRGTVQFQGIGGTFQLNGAAGVGAQTALNVANNNASGTGTISVGILNTTGGTWNANLSSVLIGRHHSGGGGAQGTVTIAAGLVTATGVVLADSDNPGASSNDANTTGTLNVNGGEFQVNGTITDGDADGSATGGSSVVNINLNGGTLRFNTLSRSTATNTFNVNFNSGTIRTNTGVNQVVTNVPISLLTAGVHNFETDPGRTSTIQANAPLGGAGSLTKVGTGTLLLQATNTYAGATNVNAGTLQLQNGEAIANGAGAVNVANLATLQLLNSETISSYVGADDIANENDSLLALAGFTLTTTGSVTLGNVTSTNGSIVAGTSIIDGDADNNISGTGVFLSAVGSVGTLANPIETSVANLEGVGSTGFYVASSTNLIIGGVTAAAGIVATGDVVVSSTGTLTAAENVAVTGAAIDVTLTTIDAAGAGQDLFINGGVTISSPGGFLVLNAGDNATIAGTLVSGNTITVNLDSPADAGTGSSLSFTGDVDAPLAVFNGFGDTVGDSFNSIRPDQDVGDVLTPIQVFGMLPDANPNGDSLVLDITGLGIPTLTLGPGLRNGSFSFGTLAAPLTYNDIENVSTSPALPYHLVLDMRFSGFENGVADTILAQLNATGTELILDVNTANVFTGPDDVIQSLTIIGSNDNDALTIQETAGGLPKFIGGAPSVDNTLIGGSTSAGSHLNSSADLTLETLRGGDTPWNGDDVTIHFDAGAAGSDSLTVNYTTLNNTAYFSDTSDAGNSGNVLSAPGAFPVIGVPTLVVSFANLEPLILSGAGGTLLTDATGTAATTNLTVTDLGATSQISGDGGFAATTFSGYSNVAIVGGGGSELIDVVSIDSAALTNLSLFGGNTNDLLGLAGGDVASDTLRVRSLPATASALLQGNAGSDLFQLFDATNTVDNIAGPVIIDGNDGNVGGNTDTLTILDSGDLTDDTNVVIAAANAGSSPDYSIDGINPTVGTDVIFRNIDVLNYTSTAGNDQIDGRFESTLPPHDLSTVNLSGWTGEDQFLLYTSDQIGGTGANNTPTGMPSGLASINLFGDAAGNPNGGDVSDTFGLTPMGVSGTGAMNVGLVVADSTRMIRPSASTAIAINGGTPTGLAAPLGDVTGDVLNLDISALPNSTPVVVSTFSPGTVVATGIQPLTWAEIEDINVVDQGKLTNVQMGDLFARTTPNPDLVQITRNPTALNPNQVRLRITATIGNYSASNKTLVYGGGMNDTLTQANLTIPAEFYGEGGDDYLAGATNNDWLVGGEGNDRINGGHGDNVIWGDNSPTLPTDPQPQDLVAGGDDQLSGLDGNDVFYGGGGNDSVSAGGGNDYAYGGEGNDTLDGHDGDDRLYGGAGNDIIAGHSGNDLLSGGAGDDKLYGASGNDVLFGGIGADLIDGGAGNDLLVSGSVANENSSWTSVASTTTFNAATYTLPSDNDAALLTLLAQWATASNRGTLGTSPAITHDGANDDLWGSTGDDDFCWETADVLENPGGTPSDYNAFALGMDERFGPN